MSRAAASGSGVAGRPRPAGPLVWVHAASVGETIAALPLIERLAARGLDAAADDRHGHRGGGRRAPASRAARSISSCRSTRRRPSSAFSTIGGRASRSSPNSELWPTMLKALRRRALPLAVVNARMSERSFRSWRRFAPLARAVLGRADLFLAQTPADAERLRALGARSRRRLRQPEVRRAAAAGRRRRRSRRCAQQIGGRPVLVAASTHPGEEAAVIAAHRSSRAGGTRLLTILAPRHPERGDAVAALVDGRRPVARPPLARRRDRRGHRDLSRRYDRRDGVVVPAGRRRFPRRLDGAARRPEPDRAGKARRADRARAACRQFPRRL